MFIDRIKLIKSYLMKRDTVNVYPYVINIESTNECNLECIMCPRLSMTRKTGCMDMILFKKIIDDVKDKIKFAWLSIAGEPFLNKNIFKMISYAKLSGIKVGISTNATILNKSIIKNIIDSGLDYIIFSFDGATKETYEKVRSGANYDHVKDNIRQFITEKKKNSAKIFTVLQCIYMQETEKDIANFKKMWNLNGVDAIRIRQETYAGIGKFKNKIKRQCFWLWCAAYILWDGTMVPCCNDINAIYPLGNMKDKSFNELWNSDELRKLRELHTHGGYINLKLCKDCNIYQPSIPLILGSSLFNYYMVHKLVPKMETMLSMIRMKAHGFY